MFNEFGINGRGKDNENTFCIECEKGMLTNEKDLTQHFNNYFENVASKLKEPIVNSEFEHLKTFVQSKVPSNVEFKIPLTNVGFVRNLLLNLDVTPRLHYVPGGHGGHVSGHRGRNGVTVRQRRGTVSTNVSRRDCRGRRGKVFNSQKICHGNHGADDLLFRT